MYLILNYLSFQVLQILTVTQKLCDLVLFFLADLFPHPTSRTTDKPDDPTVRIKVLTGEIVSP